MFYVTKFSSSRTKSFTHVAFHNIQSLMTQRVNFELRPLDNVLNWSESPEWMSNAQTYFTKTKSDYGCALVHTLPADLLRCIYKSKDQAIGMTAFETTKIPQWIASGLNENYKGLIVPSEYNKEALEASGVTIPVRVVQHALGSWWMQDYPELPEKDPNTYIFGFAGFWNTRKNPETLVEAYLEAFPQPSEDQALLLKTYKSGMESQWSDRPDIWIYDEDWSEEQMLWAFQMMDCYVSPHKGEAFGLCLAQASAMNKPTIYTGFSAPTEWLIGQNHRPISYSTVHVTDADMKAGYDHLEDTTLHWADINKTELVEALRSASANKCKKALNSEQLSDFRRMFTWESIGSQLVSAIEDIMDRPLVRIPDDE